MKVYLQRPRLVQSMPQRLKPPASSRHLEEQRMAAYTTRLLLLRARGGSKFNTSLHT